MVWLVAAVFWTVFAVGAAMLLGAAGRVAGRREHAERTSVFVPAEWSLTNAR